MDVNDNFTQSVHQAQMDRIAMLEATEQALSKTLVESIGNTAHWQKRAEQAEAALARVRALAAKDMRFSEAVCRKASTDPHGWSSWVAKWDRDYAQARAEEWSGAQ